MTFNKVAFLTVVFPSNIDYLDDFLSSLVKQSYKKIDFYFINDGIDNLHDYIKKHNLHYVEIKFTGTPSQIREYGINHLISNNYKFIVFGDSDDYFENSRVEKSLELLENYDVVVNDLNIIKSDKLMVQKNYLSERIQNNGVINVEFVKNKNILGLSNTAIKIKNNKEKVKFNKNLIAVDWYLFSYLFIKGYSAIFTNETHTFYRQHAQNTVGILNSNKEKIIKGINAKYFHYLEMSKLSNAFVPYYEKFKKLKMLFKNANDSFIDEYLNKINAATRSDTLWWENIKSLEEIE